MEVIRLGATVTPFKEREDTLGYTGLNMYGNRLKYLGPRSMRPWIPLLGIPTEKKRI